MDNENKNKNYLNEVTTKSLTRFSIDVGQRALEILKRINDGADFEYDSWSNEEENEQPQKVNTSLIKFKQDEILNALLKEGIKYELVPNGNAYLVDRYNSCFKFTCIIYNNVEHFIKFIKTRTHNMNYCLYLHETFIEQEPEGEFRLYYCLVSKNNIKEDTEEINTNNIKTKLSCQDIIRQNIQNYFSKCSIEDQLKMLPKYNSKIRVSSDGSSNINDILELMKKDAEEYNNSKTN